MYNLTLILVPSKNIRSLNSSVCETWNYYLDIKCIPAWVVLTVFQKMLSLSTPRAGWLGTVLMSWWEKDQIGLCNFSLPNRKCYGWYTVSPNLQRTLGGCGGCLWALWGHVHSSLHHSCTSNMQNGVFPYRCFCRTCSSNSGLVGSPSFCLCACLSAHSTKHRVLKSGSRARLASAQLVSPGSCGELALACIPLVMASPLEPESAFPTKHHHLLSFMLLCITVVEKHCFRLRVLFQSIMV